MSLDSLRIRRRHDQRGQGLVEFAVVLPVFLLAIFGLLDVGRLVYTNSALSQAAREGARLGATEAGRIGAVGPACVADPSLVGTSNPGAQVCPADVATFKNHIVGAVNRMVVNMGPISVVHISCDSDGSGPSIEWSEGAGGNGCHDGSGNPIAATGQLVSVRVQYTYEPLTPIISSLISSVPLSGSASMIIH